MSVEEKLKPVRNEIDSIDLDLLGLLNRRMELAQQVGRIKAETGFNLFDPGREEAIFKRLATANAGPITEESLRSIFREIFAASRLLQYVLQVAFLGPEWTYSHLAAISMFGHSAQYHASTTLEDVLDALLRGKAHVAVVPIDNSLDGGVGLTMDLLYENDVQVVRESYFEIAHCFAGSTDSIEKTTHLYAHPLAMEQCRLWILENLHRVELYECASTSQAARLARKNPTGAAICNLYAAHHHGLRVLADRIEDHAGNTTRFFALANRLNSSTGNDKTSVLFALSDTPGALHTAIEAFAVSHVNLIRIESRPNRRFPWQQVFNADIEGHVKDEAVRKALDALKDHVTFLKVLGSYPKGDPQNPIRPEKENLRSFGRRESSSTK
ncbi:MAG: prephenate dehydratase [Syntrophobacteraceae bacterium]